MKLKLEKFLALIFKAGSTPKLLTLYVSFRSRWTPLVLEWNAGLERRRAIENAAFRGPSGTECRWEDVPRPGGVGFRAIASLRPAGVFFGVMC